MHIVGSAFSSCFQKCIAPLPSPFPHRHRNRDLSEMDKTSKNKPWSGKQISGYQVDWLVINSIMRSIL